MSASSPDFPDDKTAPERRKNLTEQEIKDLKLAGGVEGGMEAGSGGGPAAPNDSGADSTPKTSRKTNPQKG